MRNWYNNTYTVIKERGEFMLTIYAVSDSIGETAEQVAQAAASQFDDEIEVKRVPYIKTLEDVEELIGEIREINNVMIVSTIITVNVREYLTQKGVENNIWVVNVLGPIINVSSSILNKQPQYNPGAMWKTDETYFKRIEAMEFAMQYDDSKDYRGLKNADVVLIGLSRTSKTPLCMYLANKGIKAINIPLVPEVGVPDEIYEVDRDRIFALTIDPMQVIEIRKRRFARAPRQSPSRTTLPVPPSSRLRPTVTGASLRRATATMRQSASRPYMTWALIPRLPDSKGWVRSRRMNFATLSAPISDLSASPSIKMTR